MQRRDYPQRPEQVYLFGTCLIDLFVPEAGLDAVRLLEREGLKVRFPQAQSCCGQPAYTSGNPESARAVAQAQLDLFDEPWPVVIPSGSCAGMIRHHWPKLFAEDPVSGPKARALAQRVFELAEFLVEVLDVRFPELAARPEQVALHTSCSARREMGTREHGLSLLARLPGVEVLEHERESECCGFGGTFSLKHPDISGAMVTDKTARIAATGCTRFVTADCGCMLNIGSAAAHQGRALSGQHLASFVWDRVKDSES
jgi:L-lactate dehydrogenase complex protein LldE